MNSQWRMAGRVGETPGERILQKPTSLMSPGSQKPLRTCASPPFGAGDLSPAAGPKTYLFEHQDAVQGDVETPDSIADRDHSERELWEIFDHIVEQACHFFLQVLFGEGRLGESGMPGFLKGKVRIVTNLSPYLCKFWGSAGPPKSPFTDVSYPEYFSDYD